MMKWARGQGIYATLRVLYPFSGGKSREKLWTIVGWLLYPVLLDLISGTSFRRDARNGAKTFSSAHCRSVVYFLYYTRYHRPCASPGFARKKWWKKRLRFSGDGCI